MFVTGQVDWRATAEARQKRIAELEAALAAEARCQTCDGEKRISMECAYCLGGAPPPCKCDEQEEFDCPECDGTGISLKTDVARAALSRTPAEHLAAAPPSNQAEKRAVPVALTCEDDFEGAPV